MSNPYFRFRQFTVFHDKCAMKVGTDGVLLGSWVDCEGVGRILDIGTGSGLLALMLAQRSPTALIDAIDIDENAYQQAKINFESSPWSDRLNVYHVPLQDFVPSVGYDLIVSNPPYFANSLVSPNGSRSMARHNDTLPLEVLLDSSMKLLSPWGKIALVLPFDTYAKINTLTKEKNLFPSKITYVYPTPQSSPKRVLLEYSVHKTPLKEENLIIEMSRHVYSDEYKKLTENFYLGKQ